MAKEYYIYGYHALKNALQLHPECVLRIYLQNNRHDQRLQDIINIAQSVGIPLHKVSRTDLDKKTSESNHQGMLAECKRAPEYNEHDLEKIIAAENTPITLLILDGVQDPHNLGACMRSAAALGVHAIIVPKDKAVGLTDTVKKVACGAAEIIPFIQVTNLARTLKWLKEQGIWLVGTAADGEQTIQEIDLTSSIGIVMGGEHQGLRRLTREHCDFLARIPIQPTMESLNVSAATAICLYEVVRQRELSS